MKTFKTDYYGIYLINERGHWFIQDDLGNDSYIGKNKPSNTIIDQYAEMIRKAA